MRGERVRFTSCLSAKEVRLLRGTIPRKAKRDCTVFQCSPFSYMRAVDRTPCWLFLVHAEDAAQKGGKKARGTKNDDLHSRLPAYFCRKQSAPTAMIISASTITRTPSGMKKESRMPSPKESTAMLNTLVRFFLHIQAPPGSAVDRPWYSICAGKVKMTAVPCFLGSSAKVDKQYADVGGVDTADAGCLPYAHRSHGGKLLRRLDPQSPDGAVIDILR